MTLSELYRKAKSVFSDITDSPGYEALCLIERFFGVDRFGLAVSGNVQPEKELEAAFLLAVGKRLSGYPLQYILGEWTFMDIPLYVGEGVLIPRDDTEVLTREAINRLKNIKSGKIIDLCSGSGAVAIAIGKAFPSLEVHAAELSDTAFKYLEKNISRSGCENVKAVKGDIFELYKSFPDNSFDALLSNPPYVKSSVIKTLQREVLYEPELALDGGEDGMVFYRAIAENWLRKIKRGGFLGVEIGEDLGEEISGLFKESGLKNISVLKDMSSLDRAVFAEYR